MPVQRHFEEAARYKLAPVRQRTGGPRATPRLVPYWTVLALADQVTNPLLITPSGATGYFLASVVFLAPLDSSELV